MRLSDASSISLRCLDVEIKRDVTVSIGADISTPSGDILY